MVFQPTDQQASALEIIGKRLDAREPESRLFGYAGTGKTTIAKSIAEGIKDVMFAAYTGKAASVLSRKGCPASTIHSLIYLPLGDRAAQLEELQEKLDSMEDQDSDLALEISDRIEAIKPYIGKPGFQLNTESDLRKASLLIVDEVSMVNEAMADDLLSFDVPIIALGDPAQLPPVGGNGYFTKGGESAADAMLTKVERFALDSPIYRLADWIRKNQTRPRPGGPVVTKISQTKAMDYDQILVGTNRTRREKNAKMRRLRGFDNGEILNPGEKIIVLENNRDHTVLNGQQYWVVATKESTSKTPGLMDVYLQCDCFPPAGTAGQDDPWAVQCAVCGWVPRYVPMWIHGFLGESGEEKLKLMPFHKKRGAVCATFGYAITVHKAQGSEWSKVLIFDESSVFRKDAWRWLYTAVTRAQDKVTIVR